MLQCRGNIDAEQVFGSGHFYLPYFCYSPYMSTMYATITSKGQITLPVAARRALGLREGQKVGIRIEADSLVIDAPRAVESVRALIRAEAQERGTWGTVPTSGEGWAARAEDFRADA